MKKLLYFIGIFVFCFSTQAQTKKEISFDYTVHYKIPNKKKQTTDTVIVSFKKTGDHLYTNSPLLGKSMAASIFKNKAKSISTIEDNIIFEAATGLLYMNFNLDENTIYMKMNAIEDFIPPESVIPRDATINFETVKSPFKKTNQTFTTYKMSPSTEPDNFLYLIIDETRPVNNNRIFSKIIDKMSAETTGKTKIDLPDGLIMSLSDKNLKPIFSAIKSEESTTAIELNHSFKSFQ